jgi:hypothetical protein
MTTTKKTRWGLIVIVTLAVLSALLVGAFHFGVQALKGQVEKALGPASEVAEIKVGWGAVEVIGLRLKGPAGWPAEDTLRAKRILVEPDLMSLFSDHIRVSAIVVEDAYVSALRTADGKMEVVPSLLHAKTEKSSAPAPKVGIGRIELKNAAMEFFDATVAKPPLKVRIEQLNATVNNIELPELAVRTDLDLAGVLKGTNRDGHVAIKGWIIPATKDSAIVSHFHDVDLVSLKPYLIKAGETGVKKGTLDLDLDSTVKDKHLHAPGSVNMKDLELDAGGGFMGYARSAAVGALKDKQDQINVKFVLEGNIDDPKFSLNESLATRFGSGLAESLGVSVEGVAKGFGGVGEKGLEAAGKTAGGLGKAVKGLFGK